MKLFISVRLCVVCYNFIVIRYDLHIVTYRPGVLVHIAVAVVVFPIRSFFVYLAVAIVVYPVPITSCQVDGRWEGRAGWKKWRVWCRSWEAGMEEVEGGGVVELEDGWWTTGGSWRGWDGRTAWGWGCRVGRVDRRVVILQGREVWEVKCENGRMGRWTSVD